MTTEIAVALITGLLAAVTTYIVTNRQARKDKLDAERDLANNEAERKAEYSQIIDAKMREYQADLERRVTKRDDRIDQLETENADLTRNLSEANAKIITQDLQIRTLQARVAELERRIGTGELKAK